MSAGNRSEPTNAAVKALAGRRIGEMSASDYLKAVAAATKAVRSRKADKRFKSSRGTFPLRPRLSD